MKPLPRRFRAPGTAGFSLVGIGLALAVISFALVALIGMIPVGLTNFHSSMNISVESQIFQQIVNDAQQSDFNSASTKS